MKVKLGLAQKLSFALLIAFIASILYASLFSYLLYERLYVKNLETDMIDIGSRLAYSYEGGPVSDTFIDEIHWFGAKSKFEVFAVKNPRELSMCLPFEVDYETLISGAERERLINGEFIVNKGFIERLDRDVLSVIVPLLDDKRLEGIIYIYYPLSNLSEMTLHYTIYWLAGAGIFVIIALIVGNRLLKHIMKPLVEMKSAAKAVSDGNLSARITHYDDDEIGQLAITFNEMAESIERGDEERKQFLANISHELRTPLSYIKGYMEAIETGVAAEKDKEKYQQIILREANRMERLVDDLLDLAKLESKEFSLQKTPIPLAQTIEESIEKIKWRMSKKGIHLEWSLDYELIAEADEERLAQMLLNILDNAIRHTDQGGTINVTLTDTTDGYGQITITDTGHGIPKKDLEKITERFYRVEKARTRKEGGTGLGLSIVDKLTKLHGGTMKIESEVGKGTTITICLPLIS